MLTFDLAALHTQDVLTGAPAPKDGWTKLTNALVVVFDTFRSREEPSVIMKILQASQVLYDIPLQDLIQRGKPVVDRLHRQGIDVSSEAAQLPISGMASTPSLALRYNVPEANKVRRIQIKFTSPQDFDAAYDHVRELGLWFTPTQKARSVSPVRSGPSCPPSQLSEITGRSGTAVPSSAANDAITGIRPSTASFFSSTSTASSRRPDSAAAVSPYDPTIRSPLSARPDTANSILVCELPPRRELPFERLDTADSTGKSSTRPGSRPLSGVMGPPTLPAAARAGTKRPNSRAGSSHSTELPPLRKPTYISKALTSQPAKLDVGPGSALNARDMVRPQSAIPQNDYTAMQHIMSSAPVLTPKTPRPASSYSTATMETLGILHNNNNDDSPLETSAALGTPPGSDMNMLESSPTEHQGDSGQHTEELATYAQQSNESRLNDLNNFIFQHLQDDNFLTLVDDMQMTWARIGTGLE
ncbi:hypothetical protein DPSP01_009537 [Paraphaeosphaeria sporulosa]